MKQSKGYVTEDKKHLVCKLKKSLYGLKQAPQAWYGRIDNHLKSQGFSKSNADHTLYFKIRGNDIVVVLLCG